MNMEGLLGIAVPPLGTHLNYRNRNTAALWFQFRIVTSISTSLLALCVLRLGLSGTADRVILQALALTAFCRFMHQRYGPPEVFFVCLSPYT
jgi:uncharacterized membrane protein